MSKMKKKKDNNKMQEIRLMIGKQMNHGAGQNKIIVRGKWETPLKNICHLNQRAENHLSIRRLR